MEKFLGFLFFIGIRLSIPFDKIGLLSLENPRFAPLRPGDALITVSVFTIFSVVVIASLVLIPFDIVSLGAWAIISLLSYLLVPLILRIAFEVAAAHARHKGY